MSINVELTRVVAATLTANGNATAGHHTPVDATSGAVTVTLPAVSASNVGAKLSVEKIDTSANAVTVSGSIRGSASTLTLTTKGAAVELLADSAGSWWPIHSPLVQSIAAADSSVVVGGTSGAPTVKVGDLSATYAALATKRATLSLCAPQTTQPAPGSPTDYGNRTIVRLPFQTTRWRVKWANRQISNNTAPTTPVASSGFYLGTPVYDATTGSWTSACTTAPTQVIPGGISLPTDGSDWVSAWVTDPALQLGDFDQVLTWNAAVDSSGTGYGQGNGVSVVRTTSGGAAAAAAAQPATWFFSDPILGDLRIEYETRVPANTRVGLFIGDSITVGYGDGDVTKARVGSFTHEAWPGGAGERAGFLAVNAAVFGVSTTLFKSASGYQWSRFDLATTVPDFAVIALGTNNLTTAKADFPSIVANLRALGIKTIYVATILPRRYVQGYLTASVSAGAASISSSINTGAVSILIGAGRTQEQVTVSAVSGTGPYTLTVPALANAHTGGTGLGGGGAEQIVADANEIARQQLNDYLRQVPGVTGVLDFDHAFAAFPGSTFPDPRCISSDGLHPLRSGYQRLGEVAAMALSHP